MYNFIECECGKIHKTKKKIINCDLCGETTDIIEEKEYNFNKQLIVEIIPNEKGKYYKNNTNLKGLIKQKILLFIFKAKEEQENERKPRY